jgi:hypothetical protein
MYTYSLVIDRKSYGLPSKSIYIVEEMERIARIDSVRGMSTRAKFEGILQFIASVVGEDNAKEILGSIAIDEVDLSMVTIVFRMIVDAYNKPINDYNTRKNNELLSSIPGDKIEKMSKLMEMAKEVGDD